MARSLKPMLLLAALLANICSAHRSIKKAVVSVGRTGHVLESINATADAAGQMEMVQHLAEQVSMMKQELQQTKKFASSLVSLIHTHTNKDASGILSQPAAVIPPFDGGDDEAHGDDEVPVPSLAELSAEEGAGAEEGVDEEEEETDAEAEAEDGAETEAEKDGDAGTISAIGVVSANETSNQPGYKGPLANCAQGDIVEAMWDVLYPGALSLIDRDVLYRGRHVDVYFVKFKNGLTGSLPRGLSKKELRKELKRRKGGTPISARYIFKDGKPCKAGGSCAGGPCTYQAAKACTSLGIHRCF